MAELSTLARPYAKAAFDYAHENSVVSEWEDFLFVASSIVSDSAFEDMLDNPAIAHQKKAEMLVDIYNEQVATSNDTPLKTLLLNSQRYKHQNDVEHTFSAVSKPLINFLNQLAEQERIKLIPNVYEQYRLQRAKTLKQINAHITSAYPLSNEQRVTLKNKLEASLNATVILDEDVDSNLIAGAKIKIGDKVVDDSVQGKLKKLKSQLIS